MAKNKNSMMARNFTRKRGFSHLGIIVAIALVLIMGGVILGSGKKRIQNQKENHGRQFPSTNSSGFGNLSDKSQPTPSLTQSPTPTGKQEQPIPSPTALLMTPTFSIEPELKPTSPVLKGTYQVSIPESELNSYLAQGLTGLPQSGDNPITEAKITLQEGFGIIEANWKKGQAITAQIHLTPDAKDLTIENLEVTGAGLLTGLFERIAIDVLTSVLDNFLASQGKLLERIEIKPGELILYYRLW